MGEAEDGISIDKEKAVQGIIKLLKSKRFQYSTEMELQDGMEDVFEAEKLPYERSKKLGPQDIIDFLMYESIGIEVKTKGSFSDVTRQLIRYAAHKEISHLILVTGRLRLGALPETLLGKPFSVISFWESFL